MNLSRHDFGEAVTKAIQLLGPSCRDMSFSVNNAPRRTRTYNPLIKSQLLCQLS